MHGTVRTAARDVLAPPHLRKVGQGYILAVFAASRKFYADNKNIDTYSVGFT